MINYKDFNLQDVLPHDNPMILISSILDYNANDLTAKCSVKIEKNNIFFDKGLNGISPLVGIEYMAQTIGVYAYFKNKMKEPQIGYLLGTRAFNSNIKLFEFGKTYTVEVKEVFSDNQLVSFECFIYNEEDNICQNSTVNCYMPGKEDI